MKYKKIIVLVAVLSAFAGNTAAQTEDELAAASIENPLLMTDRIQNPTFDENGTDGWEGDKFTYNKKAQNVAHGQLPFFNSQPVFDLPTGIYVVGMKGFYRPGTAERAFDDFRGDHYWGSRCILFAASSGVKSSTPVASPFQKAPTEKQGVGTETAYLFQEAGQTYYIPANQLAAEYYMHTLGLYDNYVLAGVTDGILEIGIDKSWTVVSQEWGVFDDFSLQYIGQGEDAVRLWGSQNLSNYPDEYGVGYASTPLTDSYAEAIKSAKAATAIEQMAMALEQVESLYRAIDNNMWYWSDLEEKCNTYRPRTTDEQFDAAFRQRLAEVLAEAEKAKEERVLDNDALSDLFIRLYDAYMEVVRHPCGDVADMTFYISNPDFEQWDYDWWFDCGGYGHVLVSGTEDNLCFEAWNMQSFDIYQPLYNLPPGTYEVQVQGFYRYLRDLSAWKTYKAQRSAFVKPGGSPVKLYANKDELPLVNIFSEPVPEGELYTTDGNLMYPSPEMPFADGEGNWYPNEMYNAALAFSAGMYKQSVFTTIADEEGSGELIIGIKGSTSQGDDSWAIWDNFKLIWHRPGTESVVAVSNANPVRIEHFSLDGRKLQKPAPGTMVITRTTAADGTTSVRKQVAR